LENTKQPADNDSAVSFIRQSFVFSIFSSQKIANMHFGNQALSRPLIYSIPKNNSSIE